MTMINHTRRALTLGLAMSPAALLAACGGLLPQSVPQNIYVLSPKNTFDPSLPKVTWQLVVEEPTAAGGLDTNRIAIQPNAYEVRYYAESRWAERAPKMIQTLLVESFENSGKIVAVGRQTVGLRSDFNLKSELREFQAEIESGSAPKARVKLGVMLVRQPRQEIVASRSFEHVETAKSGSMLHVVEAFDEALGKVMRRIIEWAITAQKPA